MAIPNGMAEDPGQASSLVSRLVCSKCGCEPRILNPKELTKGAVLMITVECHGERETKAVKWENLVFTQTFFEANGEDS